MHGHACPVNRQKQQPGAGSAAIKAMSVCAPHPRQQAGILVLATCDQASALESRQERGLTSKLLS